MKKRFCPDCGGELFPISEVLYGCPKCVGTYEVIGDRVQRIYLGKQKEAMAQQQELYDENEEDGGYAEDEDLPQIAVSPQPQKQVSPTPPTDNAQQKQPDGFTASSSKLTKKIIITLCVFVALSVVLFVTGFLAKTVSAIIGCILFIYGFGLIIYAVVLGITLPKKARLICPACGNKRVRHRRWVNTTSNVKDNNRVRTTEYKHHYIDTYICPNCGETAEYQITESGGYYAVGYISGDKFSELDKRIEPREF